MKFPSHNWRGWVLCCTISVTPVIATAAFENLADLQAEYETSLQLFEAKVDVQRERLANSYLKSVRGYKTKVQQAGDLDRLQLAIAEEKAIAANGIPPDTELKAAFPSLYRARSLYVRKRGELDKAEARVRVSSTEEYGKTLQHLSLTLTKRGRIDDAIRAREQRTRALSSANYLSAKTMLNQPSNDSANPNKSTPKNSEQDAFQLYVVTRTGMGDYAGSSDVRLAVAVDGLEAPRQKLVLRHANAFVAQGRENYFGPLFFNGDPNQITGFSLHTEHGTNKLQLDMVHFQLFRDTQQSKPYVFERSNLFSTDPEDEDAALIHEYRLPAAGVSIDQPRTILLPRCAFAIIKDTERSERFSISIPAGGSGRKAISVGIGSGYDDSGDGAVRFKVLDHQGRVVKNGSSGEKDVKWFNCSVRSGSTCTVVIEDKDTKIDEHGNNGNWGTVEVRLK